MLSFEFTLADKRVLHHGVYTWSR